MPERMASLETTVQLKNIETARGIDRLEAAMLRLEHAINTKTA